MIKSVVVLCMSVITLFAISNSSQACKSCHATIYKEFQNSPHLKASIYNDAIHKAIWDKHPYKAKGKYKCAKCHTPSDLKLMDKLKKGEEALPQKNSIQTNEPISCKYCHQIKDVAIHQKVNENIMSDKPKTLYSARVNQKDNSDVEYKEKSSWFGLIKETTGSPYHNIDFTNKNFYSGKTCTGCHSHKQNSHKLAVCDMEIGKHNITKETCISCHMPQVQGSFVKSKDAKTHAYHGFIGVANKPQMLSKFVEFGFEKSSNGFKIIIKNSANHSLLLHPLRLGELQVSVIRDNKEEKLKNVHFIRVLADANGTATMPWLATQVLKDNHIKAGESRKIEFKYALKSGDAIEVKLGHYTVNPKVAPKLGLENRKDLTTFKIFKEQRFEVK
ncbi:hypothetical protein MNB_SV-15-894 [hydrothermal vent metagenome]|uniref:Cytochrome c-552/4 domain-containing protein n=1 Tax=hydrothermal vent metagenome TaxID=652676 RepID=A0A1W1EKB7_9ZZZZ